MTQTSNISLSGKKEEDLVDLIIAESIVDKETGEILVPATEVITPQMLETLKENDIKKIKVIEIENQRDALVIINTIKKDATKSREEALNKIYSLLRPGEPPTLEMAEALLEKLFFNTKRYDLGEVGRYMINQRLSLDIPLDTTVLDLKDFMSIINYLIDLRNGRGFVDDIDHLGNRRARTVGELLSNLFSVGLSRVAKSIRERLSLKSDEQMTPQLLINARTVSAVIDTFFGSSQLSQFMDQTNPLAEMTHKRRLSALGPGGLTRERAGFEVRDVHHTHYGRVCPIETPEGPNIGLIASMATFARINKYGFIETPYRKVDNGKVTDEIRYLTADEEDRYVIAQADVKYDGNGHIHNERVKARSRTDYPVVTPDKVDFMEVSPRQLVSVAASLIPFLEHDDANRALMGSNMQRQAVPLLKTQAPLVGTGMEGKVAVDSGAALCARRAGTVKYVTAEKIVIEPELRTKSDELGYLEDDVYKLTKYRRSNQDTCVDYRPIIKVGDKIMAGQVIADGPAVENGELALGYNVLVAFMPWRGYNFEDAIVLSERVVRDDVYTSIHIEEFELQVRDTKRGEEELTREIPNVSEESTRNLDDNGIIRAGAEVQAGDILVGKVTPKGETDPTPEEKLLKAIFGEKAGDVKDASLKGSPGLKGVVIDTNLFSRKKKDSDTKKKDKEGLDELDSWAERSKKAAHEMRREKMASVIEGRVSAGIYDNVSGKLVLKANTKISKSNLEKIDFDSVDYKQPLVDDDQVNKVVRRIQQRFEAKIKSIEAEYELRKFKIVVGDELPPGITQLAKVYVAKKRKLMVGDKMAGRHGNKGVVSKIVPIEDMPYLPDGTPVDIVLNPLGVPSRMNLGQILETNLGWAADRLGINYATPVFDGASLDEITTEMEKAGLPQHGKSRLFDGKTGEAFEEEVTVGMIYILKLSHLVEDKIHARSIGPYSLITQQPLGGKAQFGGQRFGEMEVWALEAYGAAYTLQEILTVKSDDVRGRSKTYEAIVKGENIPEPGLPESFNVLIRELQGLGLDVQLINEK